MLLSSFTDLAADLAGAPAALQYGFAVLIGLVIGSFLSVVVHRLPIMMERAWEAELAATTFGDATSTSTTPTLDVASPGAGHAADAVGVSTASKRVELARSAEPPASRPRYDLWWPGSACPACGHALRPWENIPIVSYLLQRGRCPACRTSIGLLYPALELTCALIAVALLWQFGPTWRAVTGFGLAATLLALGCIDARTHLLPDSLTLPLLWAGLLVNLNDVFCTLPEAVIGAAAGYLFLWSIYWAFRLLRGVEGMGYGDFKLLAALGAWFGWPTLPLLLGAASLAGAVWGLTALATGRLGRHQALAFGPFLAAAGMIALFGMHAWHAMLGA